MSESLVLLAKEHAAAVQAYMDAGTAVCMSMAKVCAAMANEAESAEFYTAEFYRADAAARLVDRAFHAVRNVLEPQ